MPQGKLFHISWSIFTTQASAHHFLISERCNDSILLLKGSSPPIPCLLLWAEKPSPTHLWVMDKCERLLCNMDEDSLYSPIPQSGHKQWDSTSSELLPSILDYWERKSTRLYRKCFSGGKRGQGMLRHKPRALVVPKEHSWRSTFWKLYFTFLFSSAKVWRPNII